MMNGGKNDSGPILLQLVLFDYRLSNRKGLIELHECLEK